MIALLKAGFFRETLDKSFGIPTVTQLHEPEAEDFQSKNKSDGQTTFGEAWSRVP